MSESEAFIPRKGSLREQNDLLRWYSNGTIADGIDLTPRKVEPPLSDADRAAHAAWLLKQPGVSAPIKNAAAQCLHMLAQSGISDGKSG